MKIKILGETWDFKFTKNMKKHYGYVAPETKKIRVSKGLRPKTEMDTIIHEVLHVLDPTKDESWIKESGTTLADILWKLGYRKDHTKKTDGQ